MPLDLRQAHFLMSATALDAMPPDRGREVAFAGRSNAGKSSALNAITGVKGLARASKTPGRTQLINFFALDQERRLVDLPGYGFAQVSRKERAGWQRLVEDYLAKREALRLAILLQDLRRDWSEDESLLLSWLAEQNVPGRIALTKVDKLKPMKRKERIRALAQEIGPGFGKPIPTSSQGGEGMAELWRICLDHAFGPRPGSS